MERYCQKHQTEEEGFKMDLYSRNGNGRPASSDHFIRTNASVRGKELTIVSLLDANIGSLILHFH